MNKKFNISMLAVAAGLTLSGVTSCSDPDDAVTSAQFERIFSPIEVKASAYQSNGVKLTWEDVRVPAESYYVELFADDPNKSFSGNPSKSFTITNADGDAIEHSYTLKSGLEGSTDYSVRMKARRGTNESTWTTLVFKTGTEQLLDIDPDYTISGESAQVTMSWPKGISVDKLTVEKSGETIQDITLSDTEKTNGICTITGLNANTSYTFYLFNGEKQRGKLNFKLANYIEVNDASTMQGAIDAATDGDIIMLTNDIDFTAIETSSLKVNKSLIFKTNCGATLKGVYFQINEGASTLEFTKIKFDGRGGTGDQAFNYKEKGNYEKLYIHDCEVTGYTKGILYINVAAYIKDITFSNCLIHEVCYAGDDGSGNPGGDMFDSRAGGFDALNITNSTIYNCALKRDFIRMDDASSAVSCLAAVTVDHCTLYNVGSGNANYRLLYLRFANNSTTWTNNLIAGTNNKRGYSNQSATNEPIFKNNIYYNTVNLISAGETADPTIVFFDKDGREITSNPFKDADNADFTVIDATVNDKEAGDTRWIQY